jgi:hypothetical protein
MTAFATMPIPLTLALSLRGRGDYVRFLLLRAYGSLSQRLIEGREGWERVKCQYYYETVNK